MKYPNWSQLDMAATLENVASDLKALAETMRSEDGNLSTSALQCLWEDAHLACEAITEPSEPKL